jgi:hypothetical protein
MTANNAGANGSTWEVTSQYSGTDVSVPGKIEQGYYITFRTGNGHDGTIFVPRSKYDPGTVKSAIASEAALLDAVGNLSSSS